MKILGHTPSSFIINTENITINTPPAIANFPLCNLLINPSIPMITPNAIPPKPRKDMIVVPVLLKYLSTSASTSPATLSYHEWYSSINHFALYSEDRLELRLDRFRVSSLAKLCRILESVQSY